jgi:outer membrane immunogenic protein
MTRNFLFGAVAVTALAAAAPALAQDNYWTGFYVGANAGGSWGDTSLDVQVGTAGGPVTLPPADVGVINQVGSDDDNKTGFTGGVQAGYNYQMGSWIFGLETDFGFFDISQRRTNVYQSAALIAPPIQYALDQRAKTEWIWTLRPRIGIASGPWMAYATGGIATSKIKLETQFADNRSPPNVVEASKSDTDTGWTGGLGGAYAFSPNMSFRGEWLYVDFGKVKQTGATANGFASVTSRAKVAANLLRVGIDYKF